MQGVGERRILQALFLGCCLEMPSSLGFDLSYPPVLAAPLPYTCLGKGALVKRSNRAKSEPCHLRFATSLGTGGAPYQLTRPGPPNHTTVTE